MYGKIWEMYGKILENMGKYEKIWEMYEKIWEMYGKIWEMYGKIWEIYEKIWEMYGKIWEMYGKIWEMYGKKYGKCVGEWRDMFQSLPEGCVKVDSSEGNSTARVLAIESLGSMWGFLMWVSQFMDGLFHGKSN